MNSIVKRDAAITAALRCMTRTLWIPAIGFAAVLFASPAPICATDLSDIIVNLIELPPTSGTVMVALWRNEATFLKSQPYRTVTVTMSDGHASAEFRNVEPGIYAISAFRDKNGNGKLDRSVIGKPKEPFGFSNDASGHFGPPKWQDAKFDVNGASTTITVHLK
jgi:uncharacterized protein (DUF2141 family)